MQYLTGVDTPEWLINGLALPTLEGHTVYGVEINMDHPRLRAVVTYRHYKNRTFHTKEFSGHPSEFEKLLKLLCLTDKGINHFVFRLFTGEIASVKIEKSLEMPRNQMRKLPIIEWGEA